MNRVVKTLACLVIMVLIFDSNCCALERYYRAHFVFVDRLNLVPKRLDESC